MSSPSTWKPDGAFNSAAANDGRRSMRADSWVMFCAFLIVCVSCTSPATVQDATHQTTEDLSGDNPGGTIALSEDPDHPWADESTLHFTLPSDPVMLGDGAFTIRGTGCGTIDTNMSVSVFLSGATDNEAGFGQTLESSDGVWSVDVDVSYEGDDYPDWEGPGLYQLTVQCGEQGVIYYETVDITIG